MYGPALQRADRRACHRQGLDPAPRVPHGVRRDGRGAIHRVPEERLLAARAEQPRLAPSTSCAWTGGTWATCWPRVRPSIPSSREPVRLGERRTAAWAHSTAAGTNSFSCSGTAALPTATTCSSASNVREFHGITSSFGRATEEGNLLALHPTVKPVAMVADAILDCSARGDLVLDCFLGSGTSVIAAEPRAAVAPGSKSTPRMSTRSSVAGRPTAANAPGTPGWAGPSASSRSSGRSPIFNEYEIVQLARAARLYPGLYASAWLMLST